MEICHSMMEGEIREDRWNNDGMEKNKSANLRASLELPHKYNALQEGSIG